MRRLVARVLAALAAALVPSVAFAQLTGQTIGGQYLFPNATTVISDLGSAIVGPGTEFTAIAQAEADVGDASLTIRTIAGTGPVDCSPPRSTASGSTTSAVRSRASSPSR